jgi:hypothetical protein
VPSAHHDGQVLVPDGTSLPGEERGCELVDTSRRQFDTLHCGVPRTVSPTWSLCRETPVGGETVRKRRLPSVELGGVGGAASGEGRAAVSSVGPLGAASGSCVTTVAAEAVVTPSSTGDAWAVDEPGARARLPMTRVIASPVASASVERRLTGRLLPGQDRGHLGRWSCHANVA